MKTKPWRHQGEEFERSKDRDARALLWGMRTGKTKTLLDTSCHAYCEGPIDGALVLAPNGVHSNWVRREGPTHMWDETHWRGFTWRSSHAAKTEYKEDMRSFLKHEGFRLMAVNDEALLVPAAQKAINAFRASVRDRFMLICDESTDFCRPGAKRTRVARHLGKIATMRRIADGTPIENNPLHAFSQFEILEKGALGFTRFQDFKDHFANYRQERMRGGRSYPKLDSYKNLEELRELIAPYSSVVLREDVDDMPDLVYAERPVELSPRQAVAYRKMVDEWLAEIADRDDMEVIEGGTRFGKLRQILGGFIYDERGDVVSIDDDPPRLRALVREAVGTLPGKFIVWCQYKEDIRRVVHRLEQEIQGGRIVQYHGEVSPRLRDEVIDQYMTDPFCVGLVGQYQAGGRGLNLSAGEAVIWYTHTPDAKMRAQADERATAKGGGSVSVVDLHCYGTVDDDMRESRRTKRSIADMVAGRGLRDLLLRTDI